MTANQSADPVAWLRRFDDGTYDVWHDKPRHSDIHDPRKWKVVPLVEQVETSGRMEKLQQERLTWAMACPCSCPACEKLHDLIRDEYDDPKNGTPETSGEPDARITEMTFKAKAGEPMEALAVYEGGAMKVFAASMVQWFRESGGQNYVTCDLRDPATGEAYQITMQKAGGRTPAQDLTELRAQVKAGDEHGR
jgi:hypothetical protein